MAVLKLYFLYLVLLLQLSDKIVLSVDLQLLQVELLRQLRQLEVLLVVRRLLFLNVILQRVGLFSLLFDLPLKLVDEGVQILNFLFLINYLLLT